MKSQGKRKGIKIKSPCLLQGLDEGELKDAYSPSTEYTAYPRGAAQTSTQPLASQYLLAG